MYHASPVAVLCVCSWFNMLRLSLLILASLLLGQHVEATLSLSSNVMTLGTKVRNMATKTYLHRRY
jgi:hypothetical protein